MQGNPQIIDFLNRAIRSELEAIDQYWVEARTLSNLGFKKLAHGCWRDFKKQHRKHARKFIDRVIFFEATPAMVPNAIAPASSLETILASGQKLEMDIRGLYVEATDACDSAKDWVSEELFTEVLCSVERRVCKIETQIELVSELGPELYAQAKI